MRSVLRTALGVVTFFGFCLVAGAGLTGQALAGSETIVVAQAGTQSANLPRGTVRLRVIPKVGARAMRAPITWRVMTFGRDSAGRRQLVTEVTEPTPSLVLPAGWYVVHAELPGQVLKHPVEVTAGRTFKYTLVRNGAQ